MYKNYDFSGWATKHNMLCSDGRTIMQDAFIENDGTRVPVVWGHKHDDPASVLGHAMLENRKEGVYAYVFLNETESGKMARELVKHGDVVSLSICANDLKEQAKKVMHGIIREVSLVLAGANPGAFIDTVMIHSDGSVTEDSDNAVIYNGEPIELYHSDDKPDESEKAGDDQPELEPKKEKTVQDVLDSMTDEQKVVMYAMVREAVDIKDDEDAKDDESEAEKKEDTTVKHNLFDKETENRQEGVLTHEAQMEIIEAAKAPGGTGSLKAAVAAYAANNSDTLQHGIESIETLFPEYKDVRPGAPELLTTDQGWIGRVLSKVHKSPISRIRTRQADIRDISKMRAQGYKKGTEKKYTGNFKLVSRTTDPTTVYVKSKLDRDDIIDITDFDVVQYLYGIDRMNLNEELATAILFGDGREDGDDGKIDETKIRPVWTDDELYTIHADVDIEKMKKELQGTNTSANFGENYIYAEAIIQSALYAREKYKGSGTPDWYVDPHILNVMLLARDLNGRRIYDNVNELKAAMNVGEVITVEQMAGRKRKTKDSKEKQLLGLFYNLADYSLGATKGGEITHFTDFDIDFNQQKSLLETRCSGANTRVMSAIALELDVTTP